MTARIKYMYLFVVAQAVCVAVGLWLQNYQIRSALKTSAEHELRAELKTSAGEWLSEISGLQFDELRTDPQALQRVRAALERKRPKHLNVTLVDPNGVPLSPIAGAARDGATTTERWNWSSLPEYKATPGVLQGILRTPAGEHIAVACPLADDAGFVLFHRPFADIEAHAARHSSGMLAIGFVTLVWTCALLVITTYLILVRQHEKLEEERSRSATGILQQTRALLRTRDAVIYALGKLADSRDNETGDHLERISTYATLLANAVRHHPKYAREVTPAFVRLIGISSILHDIGKVGIEDSILRKRGPLTNDERREMQKHTVIAGECLAEIAQRLGSSNFLEMAREIALTHHEHWDGNGYPRGLKGEKIPLAARIVAIVDVYDALSSRRVYKDAIPHEKCVEIIRESAGSHFDPELVKIWLELERHFREIAARHAETTALLAHRRRLESGVTQTDEEAHEQSGFVPDPIDEELTVPNESAAPR